MSSVAWTPEFCTVCYKQCQHNDVYCSQNCRDADSCNAAPDFAHDSEVSASGPLDHDVFTDSSEYEEDDEEEMPQLWLTKTRSNDVPLTRSGKSQQKRREGQFLYESPMLKPTTAATNEQNESASPPLSPLLIPCARPNSPEMHMSAQSVNTYKRWLADSAI